MKKALAVLTIFLLLQTFWYPAYADANRFRQLYRQSDQTMEAGQYTLSEQFILQAVKEQGIPDIELGNAYQLLAAIYDKSRQPEKAISALEQAVLTYQRSTPEGDPNLLAVRSNLASLYMKSGLEEEAEAVYLNLLPQYKQVSGEKSQQVGAIFAMLSYIYQKTSRFPQASASLSEALAILEPILPANDPQLTTLKNNMKALQSGGFTFTGSHSSDMYDNYKKGEAAFWAGNQEEARRYLQAAFDQATAVDGKASKNTLLIKGLLDEAKRMDAAVTYLNRIERPFHRWHDKTREIWIYIYPGDAAIGWQPEFTELVQKAFLEWEKAMDGRIKMVFTKKKRPADCYVYWHENMPTNNSRKREGTEFRTAGENQMSFTENVITKNDIHIYLKGHEGKVVSPDKLYHTMLHETGHLMGLFGHSNNPTDIMFAYTTDGVTAAQQISSRDIATLKSLYEKRTSIMTPDKGHLSEYKPSIHRSSFIQNDPMMGIPMW